MKSPNQIKEVTQNFQWNVSFRSLMVKIGCGGKSWVWGFIKVSVHIHCEYLLHMIVDSKSFLTCSIFAIFVYTSSKLQVMEDIMSGLRLRFYTLWRCWFGIWNLKAVLTFFWCLYCFLVSLKLNSTFISSLPFSFFSPLGK